MASRGQPVCRKEDCSPFDIGLVYQTICRFSAPEKLRYIQNIWKPDQLFVFPQTCEAGGKLRRFRFEWLVRFPWLVYSKYLDGARLDERTDLNNVFETIMINKQHCSYVIEHVVRE